MMARVRAISSSLEDAACPPRPVSGIVSDMASVLAALPLDAGAKAETPEKQSAPISTWVPNFMI